MFNDDLYARRNDAIFLFQKFGVWGEFYVDFVTKGSLLNQAFVVLIDIPATRNFIDRVYHLMQTNPVVKTPMTEQDRAKAEQVFAFPDLSLGAMSLHEINDTLKKSQTEIEQFVSVFF